MSFNFSSFLLTTGRYLTPSNQLNPLDATRALTDPFLPNSIRVRYEGSFATNSVFPFETTINHDILLNPETSRVNQVPAVDYLLKASRTNKALEPQIDPLKVVSIDTKRALTDPFLPTSKRVKYEKSSQANSDFPFETIINHDILLIPETSRVNQVFAVDSLLKASQVNKVLESQIDPLKVDLNKIEKKVHEAVILGTPVPTPLMPEKPLLRMDLPSGEKVIFKGNREGNRGEVELFVYEAAVCCQRSQFIVPVKNALWPTKNDAVNRKGALQMDLQPPFYTLDILQLNNQIETNLNNTLIPFTHLIQTLLLEFVFGMSDAISENLLINTQNGSVLHFDNEHSFPDSNDDMENLPFKSSLLWFSNCHKHLSDEERQIILLEISHYQTIIPRLSLLMLAKPNVLRGESIDVVAALNERMNNLVAASNKLNTGEVNTFADVIMAALPSYRETMFLKMAVMLIQDGLADLEVKRQALGEIGSYCSYWDDLCEEIDDEQLRDDVIDKIQGDWNQLSIDEFLKKCRTFLENNNRNQE